MSSVPPLSLIVVLHARRDDDLCAELRRHLSVVARAHKARLWDRSTIPPGVTSADAVTRHLAEASLVVVLVSADYLHDHHEELGDALSACRRNNKPFIPVLARPCPWSQTDLASLEVLPKSRLAITQHPDHDVAWSEAVKDITTLLHHPNDAPLPPAAKSPPADPDSTAPPGQVPVHQAHAPDASTEEAPETAPPADHRRLRELAQDADQEVSARALQRLIRAPVLSFEDRLFLSLYVDTLPFDTVLEFLARHGAEDWARCFVKRLTAELPQEPWEQTAYLSKIGAFDRLVGLLGDVAYGDFVEEVGERLAPGHRRTLRGLVRGCSLFNAIVEAEKQTPPEVRETGRHPLSEEVFSVRHSRWDCGLTLKSRLGDLGVGELLELESVLSRKGYWDLAERAVERLRELFGRVDPHEELRWDPDPIARRHWLFVRDWATADSSDRPERMAWLADRVRELDRRNCSIFNEDLDDDDVPPALRSELANLLVDRGELPWWAGDVLRARLSSRTVESWRLVFQWWQPWPETARHGQRLRAVRKAMLLEAPLPEDVPDDFDDQFLACVRDELAHEENRLAPVPLTLRAAVGRLLAIRLTPGRATRIARILKDHPGLFGHERIGELASLAAPLSLDHLPHPRDITLDNRGQVDAYRLLGGHFADERLRAHVRAQLAEPDPSPADGVESLCSGWPWMEHVADDALRADLRDRVREAPVGLLATVWRAAPWVVDRHMLHEAAERQLDSELAWVVEDFPASLAPLVEARARREKQAHRFFDLYRWLESQGLPASARVSLLLDRRDLGGGDWAASLAAMLGSAASWETHGDRILQPLVRGGEWLRLHDLWSSAPLSEPSILRAAHAAFTRVLLAAALEAAQADDEPPLLASIDALSHLDPACSAPHLRDLARSPAIPDAAKPRIERALRLLETAHEDAPTAQDLLDAMEAAAAPSRAAWRQEASSATLLD